MELILKTDNLTKAFKGKRVVNNVNINVMREDIYGFIGKNGSGKSTFMKMVCGLLVPTDGEIELFGSKDLQDARKRIGSIIETPGYYPAMTAKENMIFYSKLTGNDVREVNQILDFVGLSKESTKTAKLFSLGMKQRLGIAIAMIGKSDFLILDEPTNGLDPTGIKEIRELLQQLNQEKKITILISSHILAEVSKLATRYGIIDDGNLIEEFSSEELALRCKRYIKLIVSNVNDADRILKNNFEGIKYSVHSSEEIEIYNHIDSIGEINKILNANDIIVKSISSEGQDLEGYFVSKMGGKENGKSFTQ